MPAFYPFGDRRAPDVSAAGRLATRNAWRTVRTVGEDSTLRGMDDPRLLSEDQLLRRFVRTREPAVWEETVLRSFDRIRARVATFRFPGGQAIPLSDHGDVVSEAWERVMDLGANFRGSSVGELRNAIKTTVWNACMDWGRRRLSRERHIAGSLDEPAYGEEGSGGGRFDSQLAGHYAEREAISADDEEAWARSGAYVATVRAAIAEVRNDGYREVLQMTYVRRLDAAAIAGRLDISLDNVYQRRRRGTIELEKILRDHRA
jgi:RNA polymerase sigma factor (sigma-70 family)